MLMQLSLFVSEDGKILLKTQTNGLDLRQIWHRKMWEGGAASRELKGRSLHAALHTIVSTSTEGEGFGRMVLLQLSGFWSFILFYEA